LPAMATAPRSVLNPECQERREMTLFLMILFALAVGAAALAVLGRPGGGAWRR